LPLKRRLEKEDNQIVDGVAEEQEQMKQSRYPRKVVLGDFEYLNRDAPDKSGFLALAQQRGQPHLAYQRSLLPRRKSRRKQ
jgi:hypothetical protein